MIELDSKVNLASLLKIKIFKIKGVSMDQISVTLSVNLKTYSVRRYRKLIDKFKLQEGFKVDN